MTKKSLDFIYQEDIYPLIDRLAMICEQEKIPMFALFQTGDNKIKSSYLSYGQEKVIMRLALDLIEAGTLDSFLSKVIQNAEENGHDSEYLKAMGIPTNGIRPTYKDKLLSSSKSK